MLENLLAEIQKGGTLTPTILARRLNVSVELVNGMLEKLAQFGLIEAQAATCSRPACSGCAVGDSCRPALRLWKALQDMNPTPSPSPKKGRGI